MAGKQPSQNPYYPSQPAGPPPPYFPNPPPTGFHATQQTVYVQPQGSTHVVTTQPVVTTAQPVMIVTGGNCPACRSGILRNEFTCCGIFLAIFCFPLGIFLCLLMTERRCSNCGLSFA